MRVQEKDGCWRLEWDGGVEVFDRVVVTTPVRQTTALLPENNPMLRPLEAVEMESCLALMVGMPPNTDVPFISWRNPSDELSWIALDSSKPGRPDAACLLAHASPQWSMRHLELDKTEIAGRMLPLVSQVLGTQLNDNLPYLSAHRWRFALVSEPLGQPFLADQRKTLFAGGDWCLGARAEDAWMSGAAIASTLVEAI